MQRLLIIHLIFLMNSDQLKDTIMISISFLVFILCRTTGSKPNLPRSDLLLEGKLNSRTKFRGVLVTIPHVSHNPSCESQSIMLVTELC